MVKRVRNPVERHKARIKYNKTTRKDKYLKDPALYLWQTAKARAKVTNQEFTIDVSDIIIPEVCPVLKIPLNVLTNNTHGASLDRVDNSKGYIKGNVAVISRRANLYKSNMTIDILKSLLNYMENFNDL